MKKTLKDYSKDYSPPVKPEKMLQAKVDLLALQEFHKAAKLQKLKMKDAVEIALKLFIDQSKAG